MYGGLGGGLVYTTFGGLALKLLDILILLLVVALLVLAWRAARKKPGGCNGCCSQCGKSCMDRDYRDKTEK